MKLQNGMTKESLTFVVGCILAGCCEKLQDRMPDEISITARQGLVHPSTDMTGQESGIVMQALGTISIIVAQSIGEGIGDNDADMMLGDFYGACELFISSNWEGYGRPCIERYHKASSREGLWSPSDYFINNIDHKRLARDFVNSILTTGIVEA